VYAHKSATAFDELLKSFFLISSKDVTCSAQKNDKIVF
jgi:hypothetical protein